ncbi:site-specific integrase [Roseibium sp. M-1]
MRYDEIRKLIQEHFTQALERHKQRIAEQGRVSDTRLTALQNSAELAEQILRDDEIDILQAESRVADIIVSKELPIKRGSEAFQQMHREYLRGYRDYCVQAYAHDRSFETYDFTNTDTGQHALSAEAATSAKAENQTSDGTSLETVIRLYKEDAAIGNQWAVRTKAEKEKHFALLCEVIDPTKDVSTIQNKDAQHLKEVLKRYPLNRHKNPVTRGKSLQEVLQMQGLRLLETKTLNKYLHTYGSMFDWAIQNGYVEKNHFKNLTVKKRAKQDGERDPFTIDQVKVILKALTEPGSKLAKKPHQQWGPLISLFTGMRLGEVSQLRLKDIREENGILYFDINEDGDKSVKTAAGRRKVPVHEKLLRFGLRDYTGTLGSDGNARLFPALTFTENNGWGRNLGRWFNEKFLPRLGLKTEKLVFHSLRHTVVTELLRANVPLSQVQSIAGHEQQTVTEKHYLSGYTLEQLSSAIHRLPYGLDTDNVVAIPVAATKRITA